MGTLYLPTDKRWKRNCNRGVVGSREMRNGLPRWADVLGVAYTSAEKTLRLETK